MSDISPNLRMVDLISLYRYSQPKGMDSGISEISSRVKFISKIQRGEKVDTRHMLVHADSLYNQICRTIFSAPDRNCTYQFVETTIKLCFEIISVHRQSPKIEDRCVVFNLVNDLRAAIKGINNLKDTYIDDRMFCCKLDTLIEEITSHLAAFNEEFGPSPPRPIEARSRRSRPKRRDADDHSNSDAGSDDGKNADDDDDADGSKGEDDGEDYSTVAGTPPDWKN